MKTQTLSVLLAALLLQGCADYAKVRERPPGILPPSESGSLVQDHIRIGLREARTRPLPALSQYVTALDMAARQLEQTPASSEARRDYNFALARVFTVIRDAKLDPWTQPLRAGEYTITTPPVLSNRPDWNPALYEFIPSDQLDIRGTYMTHREKKEGLGAPLVARRRSRRGDAREQFLMDRPYYGVTALARFDGKRCILSFSDPFSTDDVTLGSHTFALAADYSAPLALMLADSNPREMELARLLAPEKHAETARICRMQPFDPSKTVVLCVHGLMDSPATWAPMLNALQADPEIRARYQFWFYSYPSGYPYPYSAAILRDELDAVEKKFPMHKPMVLIGHSMGGIISRLMITDSGDQLWVALFGKRPEETRLTPRSRELLTRTLRFQHRPEVGRVIFISAPHRGSDLASNWLGRIGSSLVKGPSGFLEIGKELRHVLTLDTASLQLDRIPNSVDTLAPNNRFVKAINKIPITPGIPYHTIVGDRGRGDTPHSSDGVVPYWSSHLERAESELVVPSNHSAHQNPKAIEEVKRILKQYGRPAAKSHRSRL